MVRLGLVVRSGFVVAGICPHSMPEVTRDSPAKSAGGEHDGGEGVRYAIPDLAFRHRPNRYHNLNSHH